VAVFNHPLLNRIDEGWIAEALGRFPAVVTLDNHYTTLGQGVMIAAALARNRHRGDVRAIGLTEIPACGTNAEVLGYHGLDVPSIAKVVRSCIHAKSFTG
jgi:transketolase